MNPFENESECEAVGNLTLENRVDRITVSGNLDITRDQTGLALALELHEHLAAIIKVLKNDQNLPDVITIVQAEIKPNPFISNAREPFCPACEGEPAGDNVPCALCKKQGIAPDITDAQQSFLAKVPARLHAQYVDLFARRVEVVIQLQDEVPEVPKYAICAVEQPEFWIDCCDTAREAAELAKTLGLVVCKTAKKEAES